MYRNDKNEYQSVYTIYNFKLFNGTFNVGQIAKGQ